MNSDQRPQVMSQPSVSSGTAVPASVTAAAMAGTELNKSIPSHISELTQVSGFCLSACRQLHLAVAVLFWSNELQRSSRL